MKICFRCKIEKEFKEFSPDMRTKDGLMCYCKKCRNLHNVFYSSLHKEEKKQYRIDNRDKKAAYETKRKKVDINYRLSSLIRSRIWRVVRKNTKLGSAVRDLGCTLGELKIHLEKQFTKGMNWNNQGKWHIDHKIPLSKFDLIDREQFLKAVHFTNLQPLWAIDNIIKRDK